MTEKVFGVIEEIHHTGANSSEKKFKEVSGKDILDDCWKPEQELLDFIANAEPGDYLNWRVPIFRIR